MERSRHAGTAFAATLAVAALMACSGSSGGTGDTNDGGATGATGPTGTTGGTASTLRAWVVPESATALSAAQIAAFTAGNLYYNAHTTANPAGEIRGQLDKKGTLKVATLDGAQETPANTSTAFGAGALIVDETTGAVGGFVVTSGLTAATAAHVHVGARGTPGSILVPLTGGPEVWIVGDGQAPLTGAQISDFQAGNLYFNVHTTANPGGEIRGQIDKGGTARVATLSGSEEVPATSSNGFGGGILVVDGTSGKPGGFVISSGLTGATAAHVHQAARGVAGSIIVPLGGGPTLWVIPDQQGALTSAQQAAFGAKGLYYNVHTSANPGGEIRGQLERDGTARLAILGGAQEVPAVTSSAYGAGIAILDDSASGEVGGFLVTAGLVSPTAAHIHGPGARGVSAPILVGLTGP